MSVKINAGHPFITKTKGRENRYQIILGVFAHELGHILYTDFLAQQTHYNYLGSYKWYPYPPVLTTSADARREKAFWEHVKADAKNLEMAQYISQYISNLIDDGYVEDRILANFPGKLGYDLEELREIHFKEVPTVTELIEKEDTEGRHIFESIAQIMLSYAKFGEIKYGEEPLSEERIQVVFSLINDIDTALMSRSGKERLAVVNTIIVRCWDYLEEFCEECKKRQEEAEAAGGTASIAQTLSEKLQSIAGSSTAGTGSSSPVPDGSGESESSATAKAREKTHEDAEDGEDGEGSGSGSEGEDENSSPQTDSEVDENSSESGGGGEGESSGASMGEGEAMPGGGSGGGKQKVSRGEKGRIPLRQTTHTSMYKEGYEMSQNNSNDKAAMMALIENINKVDGFDPAPFAVDFTDLNSQETRKRLPVMIQMAWFRLKYPEGKIAVNVKAENNCFVASARIYPKYDAPAEHYLAEATASRGVCEDKPSVSPREWAQTAAVGIALRNAGFGLQFAMAGEDFEPVAPDELGMMGATQTESGAVVTGAATTTDEEYTAIEEPKKELTYEERLNNAMMVPCPITKYNGKTLGEVLREDPKALKWVAEKFTGSEEIKAAAQLICEYALQQASA